MEWSSLHVSSFIGGKKPDVQSNISDWTTAGKTRPYRNGHSVTHRNWTLSLSLQEETRHNGTIWQNWDSPSWQTVGGQIFLLLSGICSGARHSRLQHSLTDCRSLSLMARKPPVMSIGTTETRIPRNIYVRGGKRERIS